MLYYLSELPEALQNKFFLPEKAALDVTSRYVLWSEGGKELALCGEMLPEALGNRVYLWLALGDEPLGPELLLRGMRLVQEYLASLPWTPFAEAAHNAPNNVRFLLVCGFKPLMTFDDRTLFKWSA